MSIYRVLTYPHVLLKKKAGAVEKFTPDLSTFTASMIETMQVHSGIGLAAPQVGISKQIIVADVSGFASDSALAEWVKPSYLIDGNNKREITFPLVLINPKITAFAEEFIFPLDGCLSFPGGNGYSSRRFKTIVVEAQNEAGQPIHLECDGILSVCLQHEIDHINGVLFVDKLVNNYDLDSVLEDMLATSKDSSRRKFLKKLNVVEARNVGFAFL